MKSRFNKLFLGVAFATATIVGVSGGASTSRAATTDLGFVLDRSGSIGSSNWTLAVNALAAALSAIPTSGPDQYRVGVVSFGSDATVVVAPTIVTALNIAGIQSAIQGAAFSGGGTCMSCGIDALVTSFGATLSDTSLINMTTDGVPNSQSATVASVNAAKLAGWDGLSVEAIGSGVDIPFLVSIAFPGTVVSDGTIPNPRTTGFVLPVANFADYEDAIAAKVGAIVNPGETPIPGALPLFATGLGALGLITYRRKRKLAAH